MQLELDLEQEVPSSEPWPPDPEPPDYPDDSGDAWQQAWEDNLFNPRGWP